jgi:hypothetical protein
MKLSRERKILVAVLSTGLMGLAVDRLFLGSGETGPNTASASSLPIAVANGGPATLPTLMTTHFTGPSLADRLTQAADRFGADPQTAREAFAPAESWVGQAAAAPQASAPRPAAADRFYQQHKLMAVMADGDNALAIVDGKPIAIGQKLDEFQLVEVRQRVAVFASGQIRVELKMGNE